MARAQPQPSLDHTGTQAAIYPSEDQLWVSGPPINDPADPIVYMQDTGLPPPPGPLANQSVEEAYLDELINGETANGAYAERWTPMGAYGPTGYGDFNEQAYQTGHTQVVQSDPSSEQGWGVGPARRWAHYPKSDGPNAARNFGQHLRNGQLPWVVADSSLYERSQLAWEQQFAPVKARSPVAPVVPLAANVPYSQTVPAYGGGDILYQGVDIPIETVGIY
jgi:hypothetical protein